MENPNHKNKVTTKNQLVKGRDEGKHIAIDIPDADYEKTGDLVDKLENFVKNKNAKNS